MIYKYLLALFLLAFLIVPAASHAVPPPAFSGPPTAFAGLDPGTAKAFVRLNLAKGGKFTGVLDFTGGTHNTIRGTLGVTGSFAGIANPSKTPFTLVLTGSTVSTYLLTGSAAGINFEGFPLAYMKGQTVTEAGRYTSVIEVTGTGDVPRGFGYATVNVSKTGAGSVSGKLPDGTGFTMSGKIVAAGTTTHLLVLDDRNLDNKKGYYAGLLEFAPSHEIIGDFQWLKPVTKSPYYPAGFSTTAIEEGFLYSKSVAPFTGGSGTMLFTAGNLSSTGTATFAISSTGMVSVNSPNPLDVKLSFNRNTGSFGGTFIFPNTSAGKPVKYKGQVLQDGTTSLAFGYFLSPLTNGTGASGGVQINQ